MFYLCVHKLQIKAVVVFVLFLFCICVSCKMRARHAQLRPSGAARDTRPPQHASAPPAAHVDLEIFSDPSSFHISQWLLKPDRK